MAGAAAVGATTAPAQQQQQPQRIAPDELRTAYIAQEWLLDSAVGYGPDYQFEGVQRASRRTPGGAPTTTAEAARGCALRLYRRPPIAERLWPERGQASVAHKVAALRGRALAAGAGCRPADARPAAPARAPVRG